MHKYINKKSKIINVPIIIVIIMHSISKGAIQKIEKDKAEDRRDFTVTDTLH